MADKKRFAVLAAVVLTVLTVGAAVFVIYSFSTSGSPSSDSTVGVVGTTPMATLAGPNPGGAATIYIQAGKEVTFDCPANSNDTYPNYPPFGATWDAREKQALVQNQAARDLARHAIGLNSTSWPDSQDVKYLNNLRKLANDLGDAALYQHDTGHDADAVASIRDILHMSDLLYTNPKRAMVNNLVGAGCTALAMYRLMVIDSNIALTADGEKSDGLPLASAKQLAGELARPQAASDWTERVVASEMHGTTLSAQMVMQPALARVTETFRRVIADEQLAGMSLECHVFQFENHRWPVSEEELASQFPGGLPIDPWGDGKQTLGYVLIKGGLPDGNDRPLVYSRIQSSSGIFYRVDQPSYEFYTTDGSNLPAKLQKHGGQFRDVASWVPGPRAAGAPTTQPLR